MTTRSGFGWFLAALCLIITSGCVSVPRGTAISLPAPTVQPQAPETHSESPPPAAVVDPEFIKRCQTRFPAELREAASKAKLEPVTDNVLSVARYMDSARDCAIAHAVPFEKYRALLLLIRETIARWYDKSPSTRAAAMAGDKSALRVLNGELAEVPSARMLADYYLHAEDELRRLAAEGAYITPDATTPTDLQAVPLPEGLGEQNPASILDRDLDYGRFPHAMMRVDAATGTLMNLMEQQSESPTSEETIRKRLAILTEALPNESGVWVRDEIHKEGIQKAAYTTKTEPTKTATLQLRMYLLNSYMRNLSELWGNRENSLLRTSLGNPYHEFIRLIFGTQNAEPALKGPQGPTASPSKPVDFQWIVSISGRPTEAGEYDDFNRLTLGEMLIEVAFDDNNLRAMLEMNEARMAFIDLLSSQRKNAGSDAAIVLAAHKLLKAVAHTDSPRARLQGIARVVTVSDMLDGRSIQKGEPGAAPIATDFRARASRVLAEVALCAMNKAYLISPAEPPCPISLEPTRGVQNPAPVCTAATQAKDFQAMAVDMPPITEETSVAYQRVISTLQRNWVTPPTDKKSPYAGASRVSDDTICELGRALHTVALGRLGVDLATYDDISKLLGDRRVRLPGAQVGPLISQGILMAIRDQRAICGIVGTATCSVNALQSAANGPAQTPPDSKEDPVQAERDQKKRAKQQIARYCSISEIGAAIVKRAESRDGDISLLDLSRPHLRPLSEGEILAHGRTMDAEAAACPK